VLHQAWTCISCAEFPGRWRCRPYSAHQASQDASEPPAPPVLKGRPALEDFKDREDLPARKAPLDQLARWDQLAPLDQLARWDLNIQERPAFLVFPGIRDIQVAMALAAYALDSVIAASMNQADGLRLSISSDTRLLACTAVAG
jgi:hypothetical protein